MHFLNSLDACVPHSAIFVPSVVRKSIAWILISFFIYKQELHAQFALETQQHKNGEHTLLLFDPIRQILQSSSVVLLDDHTEQGYGIILTSNGRLLVKASTLAKIQKPRVIIDQTLYDDIQLLAVDLEWDVALIQIKASHLTLLADAITSDVDSATWVVTNGATSKLKRRALAGCISAKPRDIPFKHPMTTGWGLYWKDQKCFVYVKKNAAHASVRSLQHGDIIVSANQKTFGLPFDDLKEIQSWMIDKQSIDIEVSSGQQFKKITLKLPNLADEPVVSSCETMTPAHSISERITGYPRVIQHDVISSNRFSGGPLLDLNGNCLGMNIARCNRAESYAIPIEELKMLCSEMLEAISK